MKPYTDEEVAAVQWAIKKFAVPLLIVVLGALFLKGYGFDTVIINLVLAISFLFSLFFAFSGYALQNNTFRIWIPWLETVVKLYRRFKKE
jgi:uncharacterized membrane protein